MLPPGPDLHPLRQTLAWMRDSYGFLDACRARHGHTFTVRLFRVGPMVFSGEPDLARAVFTSDPDVLQSGKGNEILVPFLGEHSLLTMDGPRHMRDRKLLLPPFHGQRMQAYGHVVREATLRATAGWQPGVVTTHPTMQQTALEVILRAIFGVEEPERLAASRQVLADLLDSVSPALLFLAFLRRDLGAWSPWGNYLRRRAAAFALVADQVAKRRDAPGEDILSLLLSARDESGAPLSDAELEGELATLLVAGHETTANALAWALAWLATERDVYERLVAEVDAAPDDPAEQAKLPWLGAVCNEVLRFKPIFPIVVRVASAEWSFGGWSLRPGDRVAPSVWLVHTREDLYPDPYRFRPERFLERTYGPHEYFPFGGGTRRCIGAAFALFEMKIALATIIQTWRFAAAIDGPPAPERRNLAIGPAKGAPIRLLERRT